MGGGERWCMVTGGRGFAARHLVAMLLKHGIYSVRVADLGPTIMLDSDKENGLLGEALSSGRAQYVSADLRDKSQVLKACRGAEVVFHMAAPDSSINNHQLHYSVNVQAEGEALVIKSNGTNGLLTCCIRPSSIFGPGDKLLVPSLVAAARGGKSKFIIGDGNNIYDFTYVKNVVHAHVCAERALASEKSVAEKAAGQVYFIINMEQIKFWEFMSLILESLDYDRPKIKIPASVLMPIAHLVELIYKILASYGMKVPQLTPSRIRLLSRSRTFNCKKANDLLGYMPIVPLQEGLRRTIEAYPHLRADVPTKTDGQSKVAGSLPWRNNKQTVTIVLIFIAICFSLAVTGYTVHHCYCCFEASVSSISFPIPLGQTIPVNVVLSLILLLGWSCFTASCICLSLLAPSNAGNRLCWALS